MIPVVVINLARASDRRAAMQANLAERGIPFSFFEGVDGRKMSAAELAAFRPVPYRGHYDRPLTATEIGCAASFRGALQAFLASGKDAVCIVEDDADFSADAAALLDERFLQSLPDFDILRLCDDPPRRSSLSRIVGREGGYEIRAPFRLGFLTTGQIFTRSGARKVVDGMIPLHAPFDNLIYRDCAIQGLRVLQAEPAAVVARNVPSTINQFDPALKRRPPTFGMRLKRTWFIVVRRLRAVSGYVRAWGVKGLLALRPRP